MIDKIIGNYKILKEIGEGGMGTVYLAEHVTLGKKYALKVLFQQLARKKDLRERFIREAQAQAALNHPSIVSVTDYIEYEGQHILVSEYIEGPTLSEYMQQKGKLSAKEILHIVEGPMDALNYVHSKGIIHRDLKPSNILIDNHGNGKLTDFGIALILGMDRMTQTGSSMGTPHYMSPEQALNPKGIDHRSDIYSIGCILYELASGEPPFDGETSFEIVDKHKSEVPRDIGLINRSLPADFASSVMKALAKAPDNRFSGCGEMLKALKGEDVPSTTSINSRDRVIVKKVIPSPAPGRIPDPRDVSSMPARKKLPGWVASSVVVGSILIVIIVIAVLTSSKDNKEETSSYSDSRYSETTSNAGEDSSREESNRRQAAEAERIRQEEAEQKRREEEPQSSDMARIPGGSFEMGSNDGENDEKPVHTVQLSSFYMDKYEVTNGEYKKCVDAGACSPPGDVRSYTRSSYYGDSRYENYPVTYVDWNQAKSYCDWKGKRLPTEAEWEYAARGGLSGAKYPWGNAIKGSDANYWNSGDSEDNDTTAVGSYAANGYGLYDMSGNVWEWVNDWYDENYYKSSPSRDPQGPSNGEYRDVRGGSWGDSAVYVRVSYRHGDDPTGRSGYDGFRCAR